MGALMRGDEGGSETGTPALAQGTPSFGAAVRLDVGLPRLVLAPVDGRSAPTYYVYPKPEWDAPQPDGSVARYAVQVNPGSEFARVAPHPERGDNPNVFIRRDDPFAWMAEVIE